MLRLRPFALIILVTPLNFVVRNLAATEERLQVIRDQQDENSVCHQLKGCCQQGRLDWKSLRGPLKPYFPIRTELSVVKSLLLGGM